MHRIFVYGSLKKGFGNHYVLDHTGSSMIGEFQTLHPQYDLVNLGVFPALIRGTKHVRGEVYSVSDEVLTYMDLMEHEGQIYVRRKILLAGLDMDVQAYLLAPKLIHQLTSEDYQNRSQISEENRVVTWVMGEWDQSPLFPESA